jgi:hypothetical protein
VAKAKNSKKDWTPEQEEFLLESYGVAGIQFMMDRLGRTQESIEQKYKELTGSKDVRLAVGTFSAHEVGEILGVSHRTIIDWIYLQGFPGKQLKKLRNDGKRRIYTIDPYEMWRWVGKNRERVNFAHVKLGVALPEPEWLADEIKKAHKNIIKRPTTWTKEEEEAAWFWYRSGVPTKEIALKLNRPFKGTQAKMARIAKKKMKEKLGEK